MVANVTQQIKKAALPQDAVGRHLITKIPTASSKQTIGEIRAQLHDFSHQTDSIDYIYLLNDEQKLVGVISIRELIQQDADIVVRDAMVKDLVVSHARVPKKRVAHLAIKHNIKAVPIVDKEGKIVGVLPSDNILSILYEEYKKDLYRRAGIISQPDSLKTILDQSIWQTYLLRIPWIVIGLVGGIFAAQIIELFEATLVETLALAAFIPLIVYISAAVGNQTQTFLVRDLAFSPKLNIAAYTLKQFLATTLIGLTCGTLIWLIVSIFWTSTQLGAVVGMAAFTAITSSTILAVAVPYLLFKLKQDPASGSGPFATILQDLASIFIYLIIAQALL